MSLSPRFMVVLLALAACSDPGPDGASDASSDGSGAVSSDTSSDTGVAETTTGVATTDTGTDLSGEELYTQLCASCHGPEAEGTALGYELRHIDHGYAGWILRNGRTGSELAPSVMAPFTTAQLADSDAEKIFDYLDAFPAPTTGEELYLDYCRNCHGIDASGGETGLDIREELSQLPLILRNGGRGSYGERDRYMPVWTEAQISDEDGAAIAAYIEGL